MNLTDRQWARLDTLFDDDAHAEVEITWAAYQRIIAGLAERGAEAVILGCTEIGLLIGPGDSPLPAFDTTTLHAAAAVDWICA